MTLLNKGGLRVTAIYPGIENDHGPPAKAQTEFQGAWKPSQALPEPEPPDALEYDPLEGNW
jgi:hypothetical protein